MAGQRKSNYQGDRYGAWVVVERAPADGGKRQWLVKNEQTGETRIQLQTALEELKLDTGAPANSAASMAKIMGRFDGNYVPKGDQAESAVIARTVLNGSKQPAMRQIGDLVWDWSEGIEVADQLGLLRDVLWVNQDPETMEEVGYVLAEHYDDMFIDEPADADFQEKLGLLMQEAIASVALDNDPDLQTLHFTEEELRGIGEHAEETVTEAELDDRVPPADPVRTLIRQLMGEVGDIRSDIAMLGARADRIMGIVDDLLKASILA